MCYGSNVSCNIMVIYSMAAHFASSFLSVCAFFRLLVDLSLFVLYPSFGTSGGMCIVAFSVYLHLYFTSTYKIQ